MATFMVSMTVETGGTCVGRGQKDDKHPSHHETTALTPSAGEVSGALYTNDSALARRRAYCGQVL